MFCTFMARLKFQGVEAIVSNFLDFYASMFMKIALGKNPACAAGAQNTRWIFKTTAKHKPSSSALGAERVG